MATRSDGIYSDANVREMQPFRFDYTRARVSAHVLSGLLDPVRGIGDQTDFIAAQSLRFDVLGFQ